ncbi:MAG: CapA family protein [Actinobacteria bacterium]|nr:CapA family protein [Actinomycetota bacterium]
MAVTTVMTVIAVGAVVLWASTRNSGQLGADGSSASTSVPQDAAQPLATGTGAQSPRTQPGASFSLDWVGDMTFGTLNKLPPAGPGSLLDAVKGHLRSDLTLGNLETVLGDLPTTKCAAGETKCFEFEAPASTASDLKRDGFSAVNVANNHTLDAGIAGKTSTNAALRAAGLAWAGRPGQISYLTRNGITIALLGFAPWSYDASALDIPAAKALVQQAKQRAQVVIVMEHIGAEGDSAQHVRPGEEFYLGQDRGDPIAFTHGVIDAGADLVVGSGPHVLRGFQWYHGRLIAYSLGNFTGFNTFGLDSITSVSAVLHVTLDAQGRFVSGSVTPVRLVAPGTPEPDQGHAAIGVINSLSQSDFSSNGAASISAAGIIEPPSA